MHSLWSVAALSQGVSEGDSTDMDDPDPELVGSINVRACYPSLYPQNFPVCPWWGSTTVVVWMIDRNMVGVV